MQNAPTVETPLNKLLEQIKNDELILPEIQRDFVWTKKSVMYLFDSLFRGLPIGHMLIWKAKRSVTAKHFHRRKLRTGILLENFEGYLLDGQQRLTALAHVRDADDDYRLMFCTWPNRKADEFDTFVWQSGWNQNNPWYVPVADVLQGRFKKFDYLRSIKKAEGYEPAFETLIDEDLDKVKQLLDYQVGVIEFETD